jgi:hypothetical protein
LIVLLNNHFNHDVYFDSTILNASIPIMRSTVSNHICLYQLYSIGLLPFYWSAKNYLHSASTYFLFKQPLIF